MLGPAGLAGEMEAEPDGGSMSPKSPVEDIERASRLWQNFSVDPMVDPMWLREQVLEGFGVENPRRHLIDPMQTVDKDALAMALAQVAADLNVDPVALANDVEVRLQEVEQQEQAAQAAEAPPAGAPGAGPPAQ